MDCIFRNTVSKSGKAAEFTLGKQCLRLYKLDEQGDFRMPEISLLLVGETLPKPLIERTVSVRLRPAKQCYFSC